MRKLFPIIILSALLTFIPFSVVWIHNQFITGLNPFLGIIITPFFIVLAIFFYWLLFKNFKKYISLTPDVLFITGLFCYLILICILQIYYGNSAIDIHLHDTYFLVSYSNLLLLFAIGFLIFAAIYHWFHKLIGKRLNNTLGTIHFWMTFLGTCFLLWPMHYTQPAGMPRRYYDYGNATAFIRLHHEDIFIFVSAFLLLVAQVLFVVNLCNSFFRKMK